MVQLLLQRTSSVIIVLYKSALFILQASRQECDAMSPGGW